MSVYLVLCVCADITRYDAVAVFNSAWAWTENNAIYTKYVRIV